MGERINRLLPRNRFARSVSVLVGGAGAGQFIVVAASPLLTRLYTPEDFGLLGVYAGLLGIFGVVASLRYHLAIPLTLKDEEAASVVVLSLVLVIVMATISAFVVVLWGQGITSVLNTPALTAYLWLLPVGIFFTGIYQVLSSWAVRGKAYPTLARTKLTQAAGMVGVQVAMSTFGPIALLLGHIAGHAAGSTSLGLLAVRGNWKAFRRVRRKDVQWAASRYRRFPIYSSWGGLLNSAGSQAPTLLFAYFFGASAVGLYWLANKVVGLPVSLLGKAISNVYFSDAREEYRQGQLGEKLSELHAKLTYLAIPPAFITILLAPEVFPFIFGGGWIQAGEAVAWLAPWFFLSLVASPFGLTFSVIEKQNHGLWFQSFQFVLKILAIIIGANIGGLIQTIALLSASASVAKLVLITWVFTLLEIPLDRVYKGYVRPCAIAAASVLPLLGVKAEIAMEYNLLFAAAAFLTLSFYYLWVRSVFADRNGVSNDSN